MGERRLTYHAPVGISVGEPLDIAGVMGDASAPNVTTSFVQGLRHLLAPGELTLQVLTQQATVPRLLRTVCVRPCIMSVRTVCR